MSDKKKAATAGTVAASNKPCSPNHSTRTLAKAVIVRLALLGLLSASAAEWLIRRGGMSDA